MLPRARFDSVESKLLTTRVLQVSKASHALRNFGRSGLLARPVLLNGHPALPFESYRRRETVRPQRIRVRVQLISSSPGRIRTYDQLVNSELRYRCATGESI